MPETETTMEERFGKCPYATAQSLISGKWAILIMHYLEDGPVRFNELQRRMQRCRFSSKILLRTVWSSESSMNQFRPRWSIP